MDAAAAAGDDHLLVAGQAFRTLLGVAEGASGHGDAVNPGFQGRRNAEVVHRRPDDHDVRVQELLERFFAGGGHRRIGLGQYRSGQVGQGSGIQIAIGDLQTRHLVLPTGYDGGGELAGDRVVGQRAAVDVQ